MLKKQQKLKKIFIIMATLDIMLIVATPFLNIRIFNFSENFSETIWMSFLFILILLLSRFYVREMNKYKELQENLEERLRETFKYIGSINLQLEEMKKVFSSFNKYPESKKDIHALFADTADRVLGIINSDWVLLRIIDLKNSSTLHEYFISRGNKKVERIKFDNKILLEGVDSLGCSVIKSNQENFNIKAYCILPNEIENNNQEFLINSIINQLEMFFIIFNSLYYKRNNGDNKKIA